MHCGVLLHWVQLFPMAVKPAIQAVQTEGSVQLVQRFETHDKTQILLFSSLYPDAHAVHCDVF